MQKKNNDSRQRHQLAKLATIALIIALPEERDYFHQAISGRPNWEVTSPRGRFRCNYSTQDGVVQVVVQTLQGMGNLESILGTSSVVAAIKPDLTMMMGIAGSLMPDTVGLGDVVVSNQAKYFVSDKVALQNEVYQFGDESGFSSLPLGKILVDHRDRFQEKSLLRYERNFVESAGTDMILSTTEKHTKSLGLKQLAAETLPKKILDLASSRRGREIHFGWLLGSNHVVDSVEYRDYLLEKNANLKLDIHRQTGETDRVKWKAGNVLAVDMESYGMLKVVEQFKGTRDIEGGCKNLIGGISVRGISDLCEAKGDLDKSTKAQIRMVAAQNATEICLGIIESIDYQAMADL